MADIPNTLLFNFVDTPAIIQYSQFAEAQVILDPQVGGIIDVSGFRRVSIRIGSTNATSFSLYIGKISGATLSQEFSQPIDNQIHTFEIVTNGVRSQRAVSQIKFFNKSNCSQ